MNDENVMKLSPDELGCFEVNIGKHNVRVEKDKIFDLNVVLVDEWVTAEGSNCTTNWVVH